MIRGGWVYILASKPGGMLYIGVTADLPARINQRRTDAGSAYCRRYGIKMLVFADFHDDILSAIAREKAMKAWKRAWKIRSIEEAIPIGAIYSIRSLDPGRPQPSLG